MRIGRIILPMQDNNGEPMPLVHAELRHRLVSRFGGFTSYEGFGGWANAGVVQQEPVVIYDVALSLCQADVLRSIARQVGREARQKSMMIALPDGDVEFLEITVDSNQPVQ